MESTSPSGPSVPGPDPTGPRPLGVLQGAGAVPYLLPSDASEEVESWIRNGRGVLWLIGPMGSGRTTAVGAAVRRVLSGRPSPLRGALRVEATPAMRLEETLLEINQFLRQLGIDEVEGVLSQRASLAAKISILLEVLRRHPVLLWLDDFEFLSAAGGTDPGRCMRFFAHAWAEMASGAGKLLVVSEGPGPDGLNAEGSGAKLLKLDRQSMIDLRALASGLRSRWPSAPEPAAIEPGAREPLPLEERLRHAALSAAPDDQRAGLAARTQGAGISQIVSEVRGLLNPRARTALDAAAAFRGPMGRAALRSLASLPEDETEEAVAAELDRWGLIEPSDEDGWALRLHPAVRSAVEEQAGRDESEAWRRLLAEVAYYLLEAGTRTGDLSYFLRSRERLFAAGLHAKAYEVQKIFLEDILRRGFYELGHKVLEESAATTSGPPRAVSLGNLAIIYKNEGNLDEAVRLYEQVRQEFEAVGDQANIARVYHQLGNTHYLRGDHDLAIDNYRKSLDVSLEINERAVAAATKIQIANVQYVRGNLEEALSAYRETLKLAEEVEDRNITTAIHLQIGQLLMAMRRLSEAEEALHLAQHEASAMGDRRNLIKIGQFLGLVAGERRDYDQAVIHLEQAAEAASALGDPLEMAACFLRIGIFETERVQFVRAVMALFRALDLIDATTKRIQASGEPDDLTAYRRTIEERLDAIAKQVGPAAFARILKGLQREYRFPS